ncbi:MAG: MarR family transcriptional regulator [Firmicutes bacterium]|nr:MarR family transcriptional regulator [Bacillota bacterium]
MAKEDTFRAINDLVRLSMELSKKSKLSKDHLRKRDLDILHFIYSGKDHQTSMSQLAKELDITPASTSQIIDGYVKKGWVNRVRGEQDRRTVLLEIPKETENLILNQCKRNKEEMYAFLDKIGEEDCKALERIVKVLQEELSKKGDSHVEII